jgi:hypothetical protein
MKLWRPLGVIVVQVSLLLLFQATMIDWTEQRNEEAECCSVLSMMRSKGRLMCAVVGTNISRIQYSNDHALIQP